MRDEIKNTVIIVTAGLGGDLSYQLIPPHAAEQCLKNVLQADGSDCITQ